AFLAWANTGNRIAARMAMIAITTSNSISVKARFIRWVLLIVEAAEASRTLYHTKCAGSCKLCGLALNLAEFTGIAAFVRPGGCRFSGLPGILRPQNLREDCCAMADEEKKEPKKEKEEER